MSVSQVQKDSKSTKRMSISLSEDAAEYLENLANAQGVSQSEALRRAIATEAYIQKAVKDGYKVLLENGQEIRELVFR